MQNALEPIRAINTDSPIRLMVEDSFRIQAGVDDDARPTFEIDAYNGGVMNIKGYGNLVVDLRGLQVRQNIPIWFGHDREKRVGHTSAVSIHAGRSVRLSGVVSGVGPHVDEIIALAKNGFPWQASIDAQPEKARMLAAGKSETVNGRRIDGPVLIVSRATLYGCSVVDIGADSTTSTRIAAQMEEIEMKPEFKKWLIARGYTPEEIAAEDLPRLEAEFAADAAREARLAALEARLADSGDSDDVDLDAEGEHVDVAKMTAEAIQAERKRIADIEAACSGFSNLSEDSRKKVADLKVTAFGDGLTAEQVNGKLIEIVRDDRPATTVSIHAVDSGHDAAALQAAACLAGKMSEDSAAAAFGDKAVEGARRLGGAVYSVQEFFRLCAALEGKQLPRFGNRGTDFIKAAFSTMSLPNILSDSANKMLLEGYNQVEAVWREIVKVGSVKDFKTHNRYRLTENMTYDQVGGDGKLAHGSLGEQAYTIRIDTFGKILSLTRAMIIDDDLGAFMEIPAALGRGAGEKLNYEVFYLLIDGSSTHFTSGNGNLIEGTDSALSISALTTAEATFLEQTKTSSNSHPLGITPAKLLTPPSLKVTAKGLYADLTVNETTTANKPKTNSNPHAGQFKPVTSAYLNSSLFTNKSSTAWYLLADPNILAGIEVAFLNGVETPTIESADANFDTLGVEFRGYHDFGVALRDPKAIQKNTGVAASS